MVKNSQSHNDLNTRNKSSTNSKVEVTIKKNMKKRRKSKKNINKLFEHLRNESRTSSTSSCNTIIDLHDNMIETSSVQNSKENNHSFIVIKDDEDIAINNGQCSSVPLCASTPISNKTSKILQDISCDISPRSILNTSNPANVDVINLTKEVNRDSFITVDLTTDSANTSNNTQNTVIDLVNGTEDKDCILESTSLSMSGDSDVTVINTVKRKNKSFNEKQVKQFAKGIAKMDSRQKDKLLELIAQKIFNGSSSPSINSLHSLKNGINRSTETVEDTYIKEVILGKAPSRNSIGSNIYNPEKDIKNKTGLRMIVIDGSNVAMQHSKGRVFSVKGLKICIDYFLQRGHVVKAFVPQFRCKYGKSTDGKLLDQLERQGLVVYTPSREVQGRMITSYDDRYIVQCAAEFDGVIVSGDYYRDLMMENPRWRHVIENRLLQFTWVGDMIMFPKDPLGRNGPTLENFLRHPS